MIPKTLDDLNDISLGMVAEMVHQGIIPDCTDTYDNAEFDAQDIINEKLAKVFGLDWDELNE